MARPIVFLSDFGLDDPYVGICHAVIHRIVPQARVIDLTHGIPPQDIMAGAVALADAADYLPGDAVLLAVVDPGVGTERRCAAVRTADGRITVGPDNGLLSLAWDRLGGPVEAAHVSSADVILTPTSATFHGRDVFAPAAAHLSTGLPLDRIGPGMPTADLVRLTLRPPDVEPGRLACTVLTIDRFGNGQLGARPEDLSRAGLDAAPALVLDVSGRRTDVRRVRTFGQIAPGRLALLVDSSGRLAVAASGANAASALGLRAGDRVEISQTG
jgi:S-adenosylmethionine hydrolase